MVIGLGLLAVLGGGAFVISAGDKKEEGGSGATE